jgi:GPH family glycoside/pentoside/hexuronide:cation symporter
VRRRDPAEAPLGVDGGEVALPLETRLLYSSGSLGSEALLQAMGAWLLYFYAPPSGAGLERLLPVGLAGPLIFVAKLAQAAEDPVVGWWSDRTRSRLGRRLPFILGATPFWALFAFLLFVPPHHAGTGVTGLYLVVVLELMFLFSTLSGGPYDSLMPEVARTRGDRLSIVGMRVYFGAAGGLVGLVGAGLIVDHVGFAEMAAAVALLALVFRYVGTLGVWRQARTSRAPAQLPLREALRTTFANDQFLVFLPSFVLFQLGLQMLLGVLPYYAKSILQARHIGTWVSILTAVAIGTMLVSVQFFARYARRRSKRKAFLTAMLGCVLTFPLLAIPGLFPGVPASAQVIAVTALAGLPIAGVYLFPQALTADIVEYDTARTGMRREGMYFGSQNFVQQMATALAPLFLSGFLLLGSSAGHPLGIRLVGPAAGLVVLIGALVFRRYTLPDQGFTTGPAPSRLGPAG